MGSSSRSAPTSSLEDTLDRRDFLRRTATGVAALTLPCLAGGCTIPVRSYRVPPGTLVRLPLARFPELEKPSGIVRVLTPRFRAVFVRHTSTREWQAISAVCTHQGCLVGTSGRGFRCPCHGSVYDAEGRNIAGPARRPLLRFPVQREGDVVVLRLEPFLPKGEEKG